MLSGFSGADKKNVRAYPEIGIMRRKRFLCGLVGAGMALVQHTSFAEDPASEQEAPAVAAIDGAEIFSR